MHDKKHLALDETRRSLPISLLRTRELIMDELRPVLNQYDITEQQWRVLRVLGETDEPVYAKTIAQRACILSPSLTRILRTLDDRGFLAFHPDGKDKRRFKVSLSQEGHEFIDEVSPHSYAALKELREIIGAERWEALINMLGEIRDDVNKARADDAE